MAPILIQYTRFNAWAQARILQRIQQEDPSLVYQEAVSSFSTIDFTLQHMLRTEKFWFLFVSGQDYHSFDWSVKENLGKQVQDDLLAQSIQWKEWVAQFPECAFEEVLTLNMPWAQNQRSRWEYILHMVNHSTFHRGQIITQLRMLGITDQLPATDYNIFRCED
jgi:uncharacterized damage-inducible protein DinB